MGLVGLEPTAYSPRVDCKSRKMPDFSGFSFLPLVVVYHGKYKCHTKSHTLKTPKPKKESGSFLLVFGFQPFKRQVDDSTRVFNFTVDTVFVNVECLEIL